MKAYLANGLFSQADYLYNEIIYKRLSAEFPDLDIYLPQRNESLNDKTAYANSLTISRGDDEYLLESDFLIAVIDGVEIDSGVACEIGKFAGFDMNFELRTGEPPRPIFALFTDIRQNGRDNNAKLVALIDDAVENQFPYRNLYVIGTIKDSGGNINTSLDELVDSIRKKFDKE